MVVEVKFVGEMGLFSLGSECRGRGGGGCCVVVMVAEMRED